MTVRARIHEVRQDFELRVDMEFPSSGVTALFGPSGCGKTSLLRAMAGLDEVTGGEITFKEQVWQSATRFVPPHQRSVGYVFQEASLFDHLDVQGNVTYGFRRKAAGDRGIGIEPAMAMLGIESLRHRMPGTLSGGEKQRVAIARAVAANPGLLLMDEPLTSLDAARKSEILPCLEKLHRMLDIPMVFVSHDRDEVARLADHVMLMEKGRIIAGGPVQEIFTRLDLPLAHRADAGAVIEATVLSLDESYHLATLGFGKDRVSIPYEALEAASSVRMLISARDVSLALEPQAGTSILNVLPVKVVQVAAEDRAQVTVKLQASDDYLLARITRKSAEILGISPGRQLYAQVKSIALLNQ